MQDKALRRFLAKIERGAEGDCWPWKAGRSAKGYGLFQLDQKLHRAHRLAYALESGPIPDGQVVCHSCDNPPCCNPTHLFLGTVAENNRDMVSKGRNSPPPLNTHLKVKGSSHGSAKLTDDDVRTIRARRASGEHLRSIADDYGVHRTTIGQISRGLLWPHIGSEPE